MFRLNWKLLDVWQHSPETFGEGDFRKLQSSGLKVFHPAVAFESDQSYAITQPWFAK